MINETAYRNFSSKDLKQVIQFYDNSFKHLNLHNKRNIIVSSSYMKEVIANLEYNIHARKLKILMDHCQ